MCGPRGVRDPRTRLLWLGMAVLVLVGAGVLADWLNYRYDAPLFAMFDRMFDLDRESNVPTWASSSLLLLAAFELFSVSRTTHEHARRFRSRWTLLGLLFILLSMDESARLHERLGITLLGASDEETHPLLRNRWVLVYGAVLVPLAMIYLRFVLALPRRTGFLFVLAGFIYVGGALGLEFAESLAQGPGERDADLVMFVLTTAQETAEMLGVVVLIYATSDYQLRGSGVGIEHP